MENTSEVIDRPAEAPVTEAPTKAKPKSLTEIADDLEKARLDRHNAEVEFETAKSRLKATAEAERDAYKAFNDAVAAMKPKRKSPTPRAAKPAAATAEAKPAAKKSAKK